MSVGVDLKPFDRVWWALWLLKISLDALNVNSMAEHADFWCCGNTKRFSGPFINDFGAILANKL